MELKYSNKVHGLSIIMKRFANGGVDELVWPVQSIDLHPSVHTATQHNLIESLLRSMEVNINAKGE